MSALLAASAVALALVAGSSAATIGHDHFTSDPYADSWCDLEGTSVDQVVANYTTLDESRASINVLTTFTATATGKQLEIRSTGARKEGARVDNGDGTYSMFFTNTGQSPKFKTPNGSVVGLDVGLITFEVTFDVATNDFISFIVVKLAGQRPALGAEICAALT
ncbi:MAG TPA: hypothetical protein VFJ93_07400 [Gaiellaceae bacterium]|nr:hypothetical protein [Gaiellaceae bacterium]